MKKSKPKITAYTQNGCQPCEEFRKSIMPKLKKDYSVKNIEVSRISKDIINKEKITFTPTFIVQHNGKKKRLVGETKINEFKRVVDSMR